MKACHSHLFCTDYQDNFKESEYHEELFQELLKTCHQGTYTNSLILVWLFQYPILIRKMCDISSAGEVFHLILGLKLSDIEEVNIEFRITLFNFL